MNNRIYRSKRTCGSISNSKAGGREINSKENKIVLYFYGLGVGTCCVGGGET